MTELEVLPPVTRPWRLPIERRHDPKAVQGEGGYQKFRSCLRWEFGFTCVFCLLHETDFSEHDVEAWGLTSIEHRVPVSRDPKSRNHYDNCYYACRFCNRARSAKPLVDRDQRRLLDPCKEAWGDFFAVEGDRFRPLDDDPHAAYTLDAYDLNDDRKVEMRRARRETLEESLAVVKGYEERQDRLLNLYLKYRDPELLELSKELRKWLRAAYEELERFTPVPQSAGTRCACRKVGSLPQVLEEQTLQVQIA